MSQKYRDRGRKNNSSNPSQKVNPWQQELTELISGASGGFLFGIPLLYTMEVWSIGSYVRPFILLYILAVTYIVVFLLNRVEGFRKNSRNGLLEAATESVESLSIGIVCATLMLVLLQQITEQTSLSQALGKIVFETVPFSLGVALSKSILSQDASSSRNPNSSNNQQPTQKNNRQIIWSDTIADLSATSIGAIIIGFSIAPTDEITVLAAGFSASWLLVLIGVSLLISYGIVFSSGFTNQQKRRQQKGLFQSPLGETIFSYLVALISSALMLWFFQRLSLSDPWELWVRHSLILALPATIGGAAGRLAV